LKKGSKVFYLEFKILRLSEFFAHRLNGLKLISVELVFARNEAISFAKSISVDEKTLRLRNFARL
jgi:hypothetical protein